MIYTVTLNPSLDRTLTFPGLRVGELNRATSSRVDLSGKGVNVSMALRHFGLRSVMTGFVAGHSGRVFVEGLTQAGYLCDFTEVQGETRSNITVIDEDTGVTTKLNEPGPTVTAEDIATLERRLTGCLVEDDLCILSGSLPQGAPPDTYARLIERLHACGARVALDSSGEALRRGCAARPGLVKPNLVEAGELLGAPLAEDVDPRGVLSAILALGPRRALVSLGRRGAAYAANGAMWIGRAPEIAEVSAVGAGDALLTGALWAELQGLPPEEGLRWGVAAGTAATMGQGSTMPELGLIRQIYEDVRVYTL
ncbi:MAG: 1-phosphofructokinase [Chloroflexi bacterium]|nr:1-phosphofructokinase [Chloroflexota bacterium]